MSDDETEYKPGGFIPQPQRVRLTPEDLPLIRSDEIDTSAVRSPEYREWAAKAIDEAGDRIVAPNEAARAIVSDLGECPAPVSRFGVCQFCEAQHLGHTKGHTASCPWRRAVEWVRDTGDTT